MTAWQPERLQGKIGWLAGTGEGLLTVRNSFGHLGIAARAHVNRRRRGGIGAAPPRPKERPIEGQENYAPIELAPEIQKHLKPVTYEGDSPLQGRVNRIPAWDDWSMRERVAFLRRFVEDTARDPAIARKAVSIIRAARVPHRNHRKEWAALLKWVQDNVRFTAEPNERIQSPQYTLSSLYGDCDDLGILLAALGHSIRLPFRFALSGKDAKGTRHRWVEGIGKPPKGVKWMHIFILARWPPFKPRKAAWAEPTLDVPLGWDFMKHKPPRGRADLGGEEDEEQAAESAQEVARETSLIRKTLKHLPWWTVLGTFMGSSLSFVLVQQVLIPWAKKKRRKRRRRRRRR